MFSFESSGVSYIMQMFENNRKFKQHTHRMSNTSSGSSLMRSSNRRKYLWAITLIYAPSLTLSRSHPFTPSLFLSSLTVLPH